MSDFDWKKAVGTVAPALGVLLGGPLAGGAVKVLADVLLGGSTGDPTVDDEKLGALLSNGMTPELQAQIIAAQNQVKLAVIEAGLEEKRLEQKATEAYLLDIANARGAHAGTVGILRLGYGINIASYSCVAMILIGCFLLMGGFRSSLSVDPGIAAMLGGIIGAVVQWLMQNASQANAFFFGSSPSSRQVASDLARAATTLPSSLTKEK